MEQNHISVEVLRYPGDEDWKRCKMLALNTIGKKYVGGEVTAEWKENILRAEHSPIRTLMFTIKLVIPYYVSVHFVRHKFGAEHFVQTQRNDRQDMYDRKSAPQDTMVSHIIDVNAQELMTMARRRLCSKADSTTRYVMQRICVEVLKTNPEFKEFLQPQCIYRGGCPEFVSCGYWNAQHMQAKYGKSESVCVLQTSVSFEQDEYNNIC